MKSTFVASTQTETFTVPIFMKLTKAQALFVIIFYL